MRISDWSSDVCSSDLGIEITLAGGAPGFATAEPAMLSIPLAMLDDPALTVPGASFGSLFLVPGIGETLRINGRVAAVADGAARIAVTECYVHCAKALIRSGFWSATPSPAAPDTRRDRKSTRLNSSH